jgi:two-component system, LuxR family, response regulator FixJ
MGAEPRQTPENHLVVIVEDDQAVRDSLKFSLAVEGFAVRAFSDAGQFLAEPRLSAPDCLIIDQDMPGMNGLNLISELRAREIKAPAILVTSYPDSSLREQATAAGVPIVEKPFLTSALLDGVRRFVLHGPTN